MKRAEEEQIRLENILNGNPVRNKKYQNIKRCWNDDVVFKNCATVNDEKRFKKFERTHINDTVRSDFHRKFMDKYLK